jgi:hypothetical protein
MQISIPGIGGNLGECVICGGTFLQEILLNQTVQMIQIVGLSREVPVHTKCVPVLMAVVDAGGDWKLLPEGPLRQEYAKLHNPETGDEDEKESSQESRQENFTQPETQRLDPQEAGEEETPEAQSR